MTSRRIGVVIVSLALIGVVGTALWWIAGRQSTRSNSNSVAASAPANPARVRLQMDILGARAGGRALLIVRVVDSGRLDRESLIAQEKA